MEKEVRRVKLGLHGIVVMEEEEVEPYCLCMVAEIVEDCVGHLEGIRGDCLTFLLQIDKKLLLLNNVIKPGKSIQCTSDGLLVHF
jgi:hypothetical protein